MRRTVNVGLALPLLALAVAGCAGTDGQDAIPPLAGPVSFAVPIDVTMPLNWDVECLHLCFQMTGPDDMPRVFLGGNETVTSVHAELVADLALPWGAEVLLRIECDATVGPGCPALGEVQGHPPLVIDVPGPVVPPGAALRFTAHLVGGTAHAPVVPGTVETLLSDPSQARVTGSIGVLRDPVPYPPPVPLKTTRTYDGDLLCDPTTDQAGDAPTCPVWLRTWYRVGEFGWPVASSRITVQWAPNREDVRELVLEVKCRQGHALSAQGCPALADAQAQGSSPLMIELAGWAPEDAVLHIDVRPPLALETPYAQVTGPLPQPYRLTVDALVLQDPARLA